MHWCRADSALRSLPLDFTSPFTLLALDYDKFNKALSFPSLWDMVYTMQPSAPLSLISHDPLSSSKDA